MLYLVSSFWLQPRALHSCLAPGAQRLPARQLSDPAALSLSLSLSLSLGVIFMVLFPCEYRRYFSAFVGTLFLVEGQRPSLASWRRIGKMKREARCAEVGAALRPGKRARPAALPAAGRLRSEKRRYEQRFLFGVRKMASPAFDQPRSEIRCSPAAPDPSVLLLRKKPASLAS